MEEIQFDCRTVLRRKTNANWEVTIEDKKFQPKFLDLQQVVVDQTVMKQI